MEETGAALRKSKPSDLVLCICNFLDLGSRSPNYFFRSGYVEVGLFSVPCAVACISGLVNLYAHNQKMLLAGELSFNNYLMRNHFMVL